MNCILILAAFCLLHIFAYSDFEGSGDDEVSLNLRDEQLMRYAKFPDEKSLKRQKKIKNKRIFNSTVKIHKNNYRQIRLRYSDPCKHARCSHMCHLKNNTTHCSCRKGFQLYTDGKSCKDIDECGFSNGGCEHHCINTIGSYHCECREHFKLKNGSKIMCEASCSPPCLNNGECIRLNFCSCPSGYLQPRCSPICNPPCANGGICKRHNICKCPDNYVGRTCLIALCKFNCLNGGQCIAPDVCHCPANYFGPTCERALCSPPCENGGTCIAVNQCVCKNGFQGLRCQVMSEIKRGVCNPHCKTHKNSSTELHSKTCRPPCQNGGYCTSGNKCNCPNGTYGLKCQNRRCPVVTFISNVTRIIRIRVTETFLTNCPQDDTRKCTNYRLVTKMIPKTFPKLGYKMNCA